MSSDQAPERGSFWKSSLGYATQVVGLVGAILAIVTAVITLTGGGDSGTGSVRSSTQGTPRPKLQVVDLAVAGGHREMCLDDKPDPQRLDVTVRNTGNQPAVIKRLGLRVLEAGLLRIPQAGGGIDPSKAYDILLPPKPTPGEVVRYKLSQEVKPRADDRFTVRMDEPQAARQDGVRLYRLDVLLYHDTASAPLDVGRALVAAPFIPDKFLFPAGIDPASRADYQGRPEMGVLETNDALYRRMLSYRDERSPDMNLALVDEPLPPNEPSPCSASTGKRRADAKAQTPLSEP